LRWGVADRVFVFPPDRLTGCRVARPNHLARPGAETPAYFLIWVSMGMPLCARLLPKVIEVTLVKVNRPWQDLRLGASVCVARTSRGAGSEILCGHCLIAGAAARDDPAHRRGRCSLVAPPAAARQGAPREPCASLPPVTPRQGPANALRASGRALPRPLDRFSIPRRPGGKHLNLGDFE
jgi:hypothetical protein